jgi:SAM-dependent methyltransferase
MELKSLFKLSKWEEKAEVLSDKLNNLDFTTVCEPEELGYDPKVVKRSAPSGDRFLVNLLNDFDISDKDSILDIGCGKGSAIRKMLQFPFAQVDGLELSDHIAAIAKRNFRNMEVTRTNVIIADATKFQDYDDYNFIYLYDPFPDFVMDFVVESLLSSLERSPRELVVIYNNPVCHESLVDQNKFFKMGIYPDNWGNTIAIYSNYQGQSSRLSSNKKIMRTSNEVGVGSIEINLEPKSD